MAKNDDEIQTADYKTTASGKKVRAHRIVFNKGEEDLSKLGEACMTDKKKTYKKFVKEALKGDQHKLDKNKNGELDKHDFKLLRKEEIEQIDELSTDKLKAYKAAAQNDRAEHHDSKNSGDKEEAQYAKKKIMKRSIGIADANKRLNKEEAQLEEGWDDMVAHGKKTAAAATKTSTATKHDVKKTSTGTVYTKQRDADGNSKEFKRDPDEAKRGRGRPKKNSFSEAAQFLMSLDEELFDSLMEEGFDAFAEQFEQLDELSKTTLGNYIKKAANDKADTAFHRGYSAYNNSNHKPYSEPMKNKVHKGQENRNKGIKRAINRLTK